MRLWLCLVCLGSTCRANNDGEEIPVIVGLDLRTLYRKYLPEEYVKLDEGNSRQDDSKELNITEFLKNKNLSNYEDWTKENEKNSWEKSDTPQEKREWYKRMNWMHDNSYSLECNSSEWKKFMNSFERLKAIENNRTDIFEDDIDDLWDTYMANKTAPPGFPLAFSPRFNYPAYRRYSLSFNNTDPITTAHWILGPLTGDQGIKYEKAMERLRAFNISKYDTNKIAKINAFMSKEMKQKNVNKTRDIVRYFIELRRRVGDQLHWTKPTISVEEELEKMDVPDTEENVKTFINGKTEYYEEVPDHEEEIKKMTFDLHAQFMYEEFYRTKNDQNIEHQETTSFEHITNKPTDNVAVTTQKSYSNPEEENYSTINSINKEEEAAAERKKKRANLLNHPAVKFLHNHKNKFLAGGIFCLVAAKLLT